MAHVSCLVIFLSDQDFFLTHQKRGLTVKIFQCYGLNFEQSKIVENFFCLPRPKGILQRNPWDLPHPEGIPLGKGCPYQGISQGVPWTFGLARERDSKIAD